MEDSLKKGKGAFLGIRPEARVAFVEEQSFILNDTI